ncbi:hypothetical protein [Ensifer soli]|uniref:hypothetical protein n=1 Tax=Ciceribacter sp. sgz301302 TaxID=3342379 RepID=UPI0035BACEF0
MTGWTPGDDEREADWDEAFAADLLESLVLVGITYCDADGTEVEVRQFHGRVVAADPRTGIAIALQGTRSGETFTLPPLLDAFEPADPGLYTSGTGESVRDPDFIACWTVTTPHRQ